MAKKTEYPTFKVGDLVEWDSQAGGFWKSKKGRVVEIVPPGEVPKNPLVRGPGLGGRPYESYVIEVPGKTVKAKVQAYWPVLNRARKAKE